MTRRSRAALLTIACLAALSLNWAGWTGVGSPVPARADVVTDRDADGVDDNLEQTLADTFAPVLYIEPDESNYPVTVDWFLARARLEYHEDCGFPDGSGPLRDGDYDEPVGPNPLVTQPNLIGPSCSHGAPR